MISKYELLLRIADLEMEVAGLTEKVEALSAKIKPSRKAKK